MPGPIGAVVNGLLSTGKALWALVANPIGATIAAIVGGLTLLYKAFTATDTGAVAMAGTLKSIGNVMDILIDRAMSYYKMLWSVATFDWKGVKTNAKEAFGGIGKAIKDAASAGWDYAKVMDDIDDREAAAITRSSKLRAEIEKLKNEAKDQTKTNKERQEAAQKAMDKEIELNGIEKGFLTERNEAETKNLASKINNSKMTMEQKEAQLKQWLLIDDKELASAMAKDAAFAEFENKNEKAFQDLQKMKADEYLKDSEFQKETRRLQSTLSKEKKEISDEAAKAVADRQKKENEELKAAYDDRLLIIKNAYLNEGLSKEEYEAKTAVAELAYLTAQKELLKLHGKDTTEIETQIADSRIRIQTEAYKVIEDLAKENEEAVKENYETVFSSIQDTIKSVDDSISQLKAIEKEEKDVNESRAKSYLDLASTVGDSFADTLMSQEQDFGQFLRNTIVLALDALEKILILQIAQTTITDVGTKGFLGIATAMAKIVLMKAAFGAAKALVLGGGKGKARAVGGFMESEETYRVSEEGPEWIAPNWQLRDPRTRPMIGLLESFRQAGSSNRVTVNPELIAMASIPNGISGGSSVSINQSSASGTSNEQSIFLKMLADELKMQRITMFEELKLLRSKPIKAEVQMFGGVGSLQWGNDQINRFDKLVK